MKTRNSEKYYGRRRKVTQKMGYTEKSRAKDWQAEGHGLGKQ